MHQGDDPHSLYDRAWSAADFLRSRHPHLAPAVGIILGSGLGATATLVEDAVTIPYAEIPFFPQSTVVGHAGRLVLGRIAGAPVAVMQGRVHLYEGHPVSDVVFPTRVLGLLGCRTLIVTNAAGGIDPALTPGSLVLIRDHINLTGTNAAAGPNEPRFAALPGAGQRFFDMSAAYAPALRDLARDTAAGLGLQLPEGVYLAVLGPSFETPAEIRAFHTLGASLVGMSTVHEVVAARHMGLAVLGISLVTNSAAGVTGDIIDHTDVLTIGEEAATRLAALLLRLVPRIA